MAVTDGTTFLYSVKECRIYELENDPIAPGVPSYKAGIAVPGIQRVGVRFNTEEKSQRGDSVTLDQRSTVTDVELTVEHALLSHDVLAIIIGGTAVSSAAGSSWQFSEGDRGKYFQLAFRVVEVDGEDSDFRFIAYKAIRTGSPELGAEQDDYRSASFSAKAIPLRSNGAWVETEISAMAYPLEP